MEKQRYSRQEIDISQMSDEERKEHLSNFSSTEQTENFIRNVDQTKRNIMLPPLPKPGEIIHCQICGQPMPPEAFSKDPATRKREFKWHMHNACMQQMFDLADRSTPGLLTERKRR
jgi:hypothetical protein